MIVRTQKIGCANGTWNGKNRQCCFGKAESIRLVERIRGNGGRLCARESRSVMERASPALSGGYREK